MLAVTFTEYGPAEVLAVAEVPTPAPETGEVVVRVAASTINPSDLMMRSGQQAQIMTGLTPPFIAGMEFSGRVYKVGRGVDLAAGQAVVGVVNPRRPQGGAHAEYVCVPAASIVPITNFQDLAVAATVPMNALTALMALELVGLRAGQSLLVTGGAGMLGGSVVQLARHHGLHVIASGSAADAGLLRRLGADRVVPRDDAMADAVRALYPSGVDAMIDGALIGGRVSYLVRPGGTAVSLRMSHPISDPRLRTPYVSVTAGMERADLLEQIGKLFDEGVLVPRVAEGGRVPFRHAVNAHRLAEARKLRGRVLLTFDETELR